MSPGWILKKKSTQKHYSWVSFLIQAQLPRDGTALQWALVHQQTIRKCPIDTTKGLSGQGKSSAEVSSPQVTVGLGQLTTKTNVTLYLLIGQWLHVSHVYKCFLGPCNLLFKTP